MTEEMMEIKNLEGLIGDYEVPFEGCAKQRFKIWREIRLKRVDTI